MSNAAAEKPEYYPLNALPVSDTVRCAVAVGVFDGVHRGHQALIAECVQVANISGGLVLPVALTFDPHPAAVFSPGRLPALLGTLPERAALLHRYGAASVAVASFDRAFAAQTPDEFVQNVLLERLRAHTVVIGEDFRYGCDRAGDIAALRRAGQQNGFTVRVVPAVFVNGTPARSTTIRHLLTAGQVEDAARLLGRPYALGGVVAQGRQLGRTLGYPTANLQSAPGVLVPASGVYAGRVCVGNETFRVAISIGDNPTVAPGLPRTVEAFLLDGFARDIYGAVITVEFIHFLRPMVKFDGLEALKTQMARDVEEAMRRVAES